MLQFDLQFYEELAVARVKTVKFISGAFFWPTGQLVICWAVRASGTFLTSRDWHLGVSLITKLTTKCSLFNNMFLLTCYRRSKDNHPYYLGLQSETKSYWHFPDSQQAPLFGSFTNGRSFPAGGGSGGNDPQIIAWSYRVSYLNYPRANKSWYKNITQWFVTTYTPAISSQFVVFLDKSQLWKLFIIYRNIEVKTVFPTIFIKLYYRRKNISLYDTL